MRYVYPCDVMPDEEEFRESGREAFVVRFPDVPEAITGGWSWDEAVEMAEDCLRVALSFYTDDDEDIPTPSQPTNGQVMIPVTILVAAKLTVYAAMREQGMTRKGLSDKLGLTEEATRRLLDPLYRTHLSQVEKALKVVRRSVVVEDVPVAKPALTPVVG